MGEPGQKGLEEIKKEIDEITKKIIKRMEDIGPEDVIDYREDQVIKKLLNEICKLYREEVNECEHYDESKEPNCKLIIDEPEIIRSLELSEERLCPIRPKPNYE
ncbi:MAG: hypothetical protein L6M37_02635 [Candidatus Methylarchaceae archaeon HK02M1]|nr:hypothetical protein [Candidatus Methylarchaceae archaeon HK02M1]